MADKPGGGTESYAELVEQAAEGIFRSTPEGRYLLVNPALARLYGYPSPDALLAELTDITEQLYVEAGRRRTFVEQIDRDGLVTGFESEVRRRDGSRIWISVYARAVRDDDGRTRYYEGFVHDITVRRLAEAQLEYRLCFESLITSISSELINSPASQVPAAITEALARLGSFCGADRAYILLYRERGAVMDSAYEWCAAGIASYRDTLQNVPTSSLPLFDCQMKSHLPFHVPSVDSLPDEARAEREEFQREHIRSLVCLPMLCAGGLVGVIGFDAVREEKRWDPDTVVLLKVVGETLAGALVRQTAEEQQRQLEAQVQHAQKLESLGVLAGGIAHDFNNLLMGVLGNAELALLQLPTASAARETLLRLSTTAQRAADLTGQLLAYSGKGKFVLEPINLSSLVREMTHLLQVSISKNARLVCQLDDRLPLVEGDATQLRQVVMNLITNASDAIGDRPGSIFVRSGQVSLETPLVGASMFTDEPVEGPCVFVEVSDTGSGMDQATRQRIFDPFFTTKFTGRGLGLAAVLGIVRGHRGAVRVYSEPGQGTTIRVLLPCQPGLAALPPPSEPPLPAAHHGGTVLVVDDQEVVRDVVQATLESCGYTVLCAVDGVDGVEQFARHGDQVDVVLLDLTMPNMSGEETFRELRRLRTDVPILLSSGYSEQDAMARFAGAGLAGFIQKPYGPHALLSRIAETLDRPPPP